MTSAPTDATAGIVCEPTLPLHRYKDLLRDDRRRIRLHDALVGEIKGLQDILGEEQFPVRNVHDLGVEDYLARVERYETLAGPLLPILAAGGHWAVDEHARLLGRCLGRLADPPGERSGITALLNLRCYPALLCVYSCGVGAILAGRYDTLKTILVSTRSRKENESVPLVRALAHNDVIDGGLLRRRPELERHRSPTSDHLFAVLKEPLSGLAIDEMEYQGAFDRFEYLFALVHGDLCEKDGSTGHIWGPIGCFLWRRGVLEEVGHEIDGLGGDWPPLKAGFFGGSIERAKLVKEQIDKTVHRQGW
ncbi:MAG: hypothetical protein BGO49_23030 [Planctomycetales bacterium 71-10]|nr:MAG: hypothetical protein BGO49_23030 [Planctomycetales bacterium 71-10]